MKCFSRVPSSPVSARGESVSLYWTYITEWIFPDLFLKLFPTFPFSFTLPGQAPLPLGWSSHTVWVCSCSHSEVHKLFVTQEAWTLEGEIVCVCVKSICSMYEKRPYSSREWHWFSMTREEAVTLEAYFDKKHTHTVGDDKVCVRAV